MNQMKLSSEVIGESKAFSLLALLCIVLVVMVGGVLPALAQGTPEQVEIALPEPTGSYPVGRTIFEWTDSKRDEIHSDVDGEKRELVVWMWYPANLVGDAQPAAYMPGLLGDSFRASLGLDTSRIQIGNYADVPLASTDEQYPVLVFSHGSGSLLPVHTALLVEIASHGYIVVGIQHPYNALVTSFADGRVIAAHPEAVSKETVQYWSEDTAFVIDQLQVLNVESELVAGRLDLSRLGVFGHSFGGATAADFCHADTRCDAGVNFDGSYSGVAADEGVTQPFMQVFSDTSCEEIVANGNMPSLEACQQILDQNKAGWQTMFETSTTSYRVRIAGTRHGSFSDVPFLLPLLPQFADGATIAPERAWRITSDYTLAFFDKYLKGEDVSLLDAPSPDYPEVTFERHEN